MVISKRSLHYRIPRYIYSLNGIAAIDSGGANCGPGDPQTLCTYFWWVTLCPLLFLLSWVAAAMIAFLYVAIVLPCAGVIRVWRWLWRSTPRSHAASATVVALEFLRAKKRRVCPLLTYED